MSGHLKTNPRQLNEWDDFLGTVPIAIANVPKITSIDTGTFVLCIYNKRDRTIYGVLADDTIMVSPCAKALEWTPVDFTIHDYLFLQQRDRRALRRIV